MTAVARQPRTLWVDAVTVVGTRDGESWDVERYRQREREREKEREIEREIDRERDREIDRERERVKKEAELQ